MSRQGTISLFTSQTGKPITQKGDAAFSQRDKCSEAKLWKKANLLTLDEWLYSLDSETFRPFQEVSICGKEITEMKGHFCTKGFLSALIGRENVSLLWHKTLERERAHLAICLSAYKGQEKKTLPSLCAGPSWKFNDYVYLEVKLH